MYRTRPIRRRHPPPPRIVLRGATAAFWSLLLFAITVGGDRALLGAPVLIGIVLPPGVVAAQASDVPHASRISLRVDPPLAESAFAPRVLDTVVVRDPVPDRAEPFAVAPR
jgi:hypothetical protein